MPIRIWTMAAVYLLLATMFCLTLHRHAQAADIVRVGGAGAGLATMRLLGEAFEKDHSGIKIQVFPSLGSAGGIAALSKGSLDIVTSSRQLKQDERIGNITEVEYAKTPFVFVTHKNVDKDGLTVSELENIYSGKTKNWPDGSRIRLVLRPDTDSDTKIVRSISHGMDQALKVAGSSKAKILAITDQDCTGTVARAPGSLGTSTLTQIVTEKLVLKILAFDGVVPSIKSLADGTYRLSKTLYLINGSNSRPAVKQFTEFVLTNKGRKILESSGNLVPPPLKNK